MIKLKLPPEPPELTAHKARLTKEFLKDKNKSVWKDKGVEDAIKCGLLGMTHNKCAYSEAPLGENGNPWEVEHFSRKVYILRRWWSGGISCLRARFAIQEKFRSM